MTRLRTGLLGCGGIAARHAGAIAALPDDLQLVACCTRDAGKASAFAAKHGGTAFTDFRRMLDEARVDLLIVAVPPYAHDGQVERAAAAGVHLLVEKPIALDLSRAERMVRAVREAAVVAACGFMYRFGDAVTRWQTARAAGETGRIGLFVGQFHCNALHADWWRERAKSGGQMVEQLIHMVDLARCELGMPRRVYARAANLFHRHIDRYDVEDVSAIVLGYDDGPIAVFNATNAAVPGTWDKLWQIVGERMTGCFTGWNAATLTHTADGPREERIDSQTDVFVAQLRDIVDAIRAHRAPRVPLEDGALALRIVLAARQSADEGREVEL